MLSGPAAASKDGLLPFFAKYPNIDLSLWYLSHGWANGDHQACEWRSGAITAANGNLRLTLSDRGGSKRPIGCGEIQSKARYGFGRYEARMKTAAGSGLNTAFFTFIGPPMGVAEHDEIDFEFLGKDPTTVELAMWVNAKKYGPVVHQLGFDASRDFHDYAFEWLPDRIRWYVDGRLVHETPPGIPIPRNPGKIFFSLWAGSKIEDSWLGPFTYTGPVSAEVAWTKFTPLPWPDAP